MPRALTLLAIAALAAPATSHAQFTIPVPPAIDVQQVRAQDIQAEYLRWRFVTMNKAARMEAMRHAFAADSVRVRVIRDSIARIDEARAKVLRSDSLRLEPERVAAFCAEKLIEVAACTAALQPSALAAHVGDGPGHERRLQETHFRETFPGMVNRSQLAIFMHRAGGSGSFSFANQFAANVSDDESYVVTNVVRGLAGRSIFSMDYAAVVTKADSGNAASRDTLESDKGNLIRAVNNGGTLVARFAFPMFARSGGTVSSAAGVTVSGGIIGPVATADDSKRTGAYSGAAEWSSAVSIRSLGGDYTTTAELMLGARVGYTRSHHSLLQEGGFRDVMFRQFVVGLRQNNAVTISALVSLVNHDFQDLVPRLTLNLTALR